MYIRTVALRLKTFFQGKLERLIPEISRIEMDLSEALLVIFHNYYIIELFFDENE